MSRVFTCRHGYVNWIDGLAEKRGDRIWCVRRKGRIQIGIWNLMLVARWGQNERI